MFAVKARSLPSTERHFTLVGSGDTEKQWAGKAC